VTNTNWRAEGGEAVADEDGRILWRGAPDGGRVTTALAIGGSDDGIVLLDCEARPITIESWHPYPNVLRLSPSGEVVWRCGLLATANALEVLSVNRLGRRKTGCGCPLLRGHPRPPIGVHFGIDFHEVAPPITGLRPPELVVSTACSGLVRSSHDQPTYVEKANDQEQD
jgi:hypothetical protein